MCCGWSARPLARRRCASRAAPASGSTTPANGRGGAGDSSIALRRMFPPPQPAASPGKIEVIEFFSYMCPHCKEFYPLVSIWAAKLPRNVVFRRVPVGFNRPAWINLARTYYALQVSGDLDKLDGALFHAIHDEHLQLFDAQSLADWVGKNGGHEEQFAAAYASFGVNNQTVQADQLAEKYGIEAVPTLTVNGEYLAMGKQFAHMLAHT